MTDPEELDPRYEILNTVSVGPRATVVQAIDRVHERMVALKIQPVLDGDRDALLAEARVLMGVAPHPALPVVRGDFFTRDGDRYVLVMNWIDGRNLQEVVDDQGDPGLPFRDVMHDLGLVAAALDHLHAHDPAIVHGDVKPDNVIRTPSGDVVLVDFDLAGSLADNRRAGTIGYVAPEVGAGEKPGPQADVYGLAATAMTLLSGQPPTDSLQSFPGLDLITQGRVAHVLRRALATDPAKRPETAGALIDALRAAANAEHPSGVLALLAFEVAHAHRLWRDDPDEMTSALRRLGAVCDDVVEQHHGRVIASMNEADRTIVVFSDASPAALAALDLHDRLAAESFPPGFELKLRCALAIGEATFNHGVYMGAVVDHVLRLRAAAQPGTTITSESTAELLVGLVGPEMSIVPLGAADGPELGPSSIFALVRSGQEATVKPLSALTRDVRSNVENAGLDAAPEHRVSRRSIALDAATHPATMTALTALGLAAIFNLVLSVELGFAGVTQVVMVVAGASVLGCFCWLFAREQAARQASIAVASEERETELRALQAARERADTRQRIAAGFARLETPDCEDGIRVVDSLADEFDATLAAVERIGGRPSGGWSASLPDLVSETYRYGMSALSDALELFESATGRRQRRLAGELIEIEERVAGDRYTHESERRRDKERQNSHRQLLERYQQSRDRAVELLFEAERCTAAIAEARIEIASLRAGDTHVDVDVVVNSLELAIERVRRVQEAFRRLGHGRTLAETRIGEPEDNAPNNDKNATSDEKKDG